MGGSLLIMDDSKNCVLVARREYTTILNQHLYPGMYQGLKSIWDDAKKTAPPRRVYEEFQHRLTKVKKWNQDVIDNEYRRIVDKSRCDWLDELIKRVFVINTQILAAVNMHTVDPHKKIKVKVPTGDKFIHFCYKECARSFYENALLMEDRPGAITRVEQIKNLQKAYKLITTCIENTVRNMLPIESLLRDNMDSDGEGEDATPNPMMFPSMRPPPISEGNWRKSSQPDSKPYFPTYDSQEAPPAEKLFATESEAPPTQEHTEKPQSTFDPESLFEPIGKQDSDKDGHDERERERERERDNERDRDRERSYDGGRPTERESGELKTIYIGSSSKSKNHELHSEDSDEPAPVRSSYVGMSGGGNPDEIVGEVSTAEIPMLSHRSPREQMDLDVHTAQNELPISGKKAEDSTAATSETLKDNAVPPLEHFDTANFFSDVE